MDRSIAIMGAGLGLCVLVFIFTVAAQAGATQKITDAAGKIVVLPDKVDHIICSGSGCLRLVTYLGAQNLVVGVDDIERRNNRFDARPYALANPQFKTLPVFGGFRGRDIPEKILGLPVLPQVIFKIHGVAGDDPGKLSRKTGIPVVTLKYGDLVHSRQDFYNALTILGQALDRQARAQEVIHFFDAEIQALEDRTRNVPGAEKKTCFVGGIAFKGPHGFQSTEPRYPPFEFVNARNIARPADHGTAPGQSNFSREKILTLDPRVLFLDLSTLQMGSDQGGLYELQKDPVYQGLSAVKAGAVFGVLPYNWYAQNFGSILADSWFIGKILYPEQFTDIEPEQKADEIYTFLLSKPVFQRMNQSFDQKVFKRINLN
ncbi:iron transport periplasmic binding protein [Desulforapulum autotrophicum HRM2]|uniref:Iron transport periplasmic binding protein n=1 Tax=Desulforapulum autotrophicum (strain ATCC 43914 / DSM 3382 / VKM B-1955 / HRM2) TaxID=177437 RepID=C0QHC2_DESAH|nr:iron ABC transporter substrate-binding protein [Desulforapulum autotrophicum]ACN17781.1 iron transport periplasmic binding protein [Desulforapulum autotrophicum HRM2]